MGNGLLGLNVRTLGVSRDAIMSAAQQIGGRFILVQDDPDLVRAAKAAGLTTIYRQSGDETLSTPPDVFVQTRAEKGADYVYLTNELDPTPELLDWTRRAIDYATQRNIKLCIFNFSTGRTNSQWDTCRDVARRAVSGGHAVGLHIYLTNSEHTDLQWLNLKRDLGGLWLVTEYAVYRDAYHGYRGLLTPQQYGAFFDATLPLFEAEHMPVLLFSGDNWPANEQGKASGFGVLDNTAVVNEIARVNRTFTWNGLPVIPTLPDRNTLGNPQSVLVTKTIAADVNIRSAPNRSSDVVGTFKTGDTITLRPQHTGLLDSYLWYAIEAPKVGWSANVFDFVPAVQDTPIIKLNIPFVSQSGINASKKNNDCGCACAVMAARYRYTQSGFADPTYFTVDDFALKTSLAAADDGLTPQEIAVLLTGYGIRAQAQRPLDLPALSAQLQARKPVITLVNYRHVNPSYGKDLGHFITLTGYGQRGYWFHDSYLMGADRYITNEALTQAMTDVSTFASFPLQGVLITA